MSEPTKFLLTEDAIPTHWVNLLPDLPGEPLPPLSPRHRPARRARRPHADLPDGPDRAGGLARAGDRDPRPGARGLQAVAADAAVPRAPAGAGARHDGADLLQVRGRLPRRLAQAEHRGAAGLRERAGRDQEARRRRPAPASGAPSLAFACSLFGLECEVFMVGSSYDQKPYRRSMMETWGATRAPLAVRPAPRRAARRPSTRRARSASRSPRRSRSRRRTRPATTRSARCSTTCCCTRP